MHNMIKLVLSMVANLSGGLIKKHINSQYDNNLFSYQFYNCIVSAVSAIVLWIMSDSLKVSVFTLITAIVFGIVTLIQQITNLYALELGPLSYTSVFISLSSLIPTVSGALFWNEQISFIQYCGIALMICCFVLSVNPDKSDKKTNSKWLLLCILAFICTGIIGFMQKFHQSSEYKNELDTFLIIAFTISFIFSALHSIFICKKSDKEVFKTKTSIVQLIPIVLMVLSGIFVALNNKFNLYLSGVLDSAVFFPTVNGGGLVLTSVFACIFFKEKLSLRQWIGIFAGIISVILISDPTG